MTYHLGTIALATTDDPAEPLPEQARWYRVTPSVLTWLRSAYPNDTGVRDEVIGPSATAENSFIGIVPGGEDMFYLSCRGERSRFGLFGRHSSVRNPYADPVGEQLLTWQFVSDVCGLNRRGIEQREPAPPVNKPRMVVRQPAKTNWGLYIAAGAGAGLLLFGLSALASAKR